MSAEHLDPHRSFPFRRMTVGLSLFLAGLLLAAGPGHAQTVIKLATLVPDRSTWHEILLDQVHRWEADAGEGLQVRIYPGGVAGDDPAVVRKMRIGQFQGAALSVEGLVAIDEAFRVFQVPMFYRSPEEVFHVLDALSPLLRERLEERGFVLLNWGYGGWVHLYSREPIRSVADLRSQKMFLWGGEERSMRISRSVGMQPVGLAATDIMMGLQTGMIDAIATTPLAALSFQWFRLTPHQLDPGIAPLIGATVLTKRAWDSQSPKQQAAGLATAATTYERLRTEVTRAEKEAVEAMKERGLTISTVEVRDPQWTEIVEGLAEGYRRELVPADVYDLAVRARDAFRRTQSTPSNDPR
jgi:TRAP-type C4-dicarboxylate transport system substrate-binding protein